MTPEETELRELWKLIPDAGCKGLCVAGCGPIGMSILERELLAGHMTFGQFPSAAHMLAEYLEDPEAYQCPLLIGGRCSAYNDRPTICRLFGADEGMPCPHGCKPDVVLTFDESSEIMQLSMDIGGMEGE